MQYSLIGPTSRTWTDARGRTWGLDFTWQIVDGGLECVGVMIRSHPRADLQHDPLRFHARALAPVTSSLIRELHLANLIYSEKTKLVELHRERFAELPETWQEPVEPLLDRHDEPSGPPRPAGRRPLYGPEHFREVARVYLADRRRSGSQARPTMAVAEHFGVPRSTANKWVARARRLRLIGGHDGDGA